jgi:hypothetical protein
MIESFQFIRTRCESPEEIMQSKFIRYVDRQEIVDIVCELVRHDTTNPPGDEYLCREAATNCMRKLGMEISYFEKEPGRGPTGGAYAKGSRRSTEAYAGSVLQGDELIAIDSIESQLRRPALEYV